jgi:hypothetical protein
MAVAKRNQSASKTAVPVATARSSRGRKAEAIKEYIPETPVRRYRTRSDYVGEKWDKIVLGATPARTQRAVSQVVHDPVSKKNVSTGVTAKPPKPPVPAPMKVAVTVKPIDDHANPVIVSDAGESLDDVSKVANEVAFGLMNLCNHYTIAGKGNVAEIEIHIKIRPTGARLTSQNVEDLNATIN